jgi:2-oxoglutarate ferredoxin oxidoreductase subunit beta
LSAADRVLHTDELAREYLVGRNLPTIWCRGCGIGTVVAATLRAIHKLGMARERVVFTIGIGCSGYSSRYVNFDVAHTTHGRALAVATGIKLANPSLKVITLTGDGDCLAIGGNHFIHTARRNLDVTTVIFNNGIYGMTGGQYSPATPLGMLSTTSPYGMIEGGFDVAGLAVAAGATYVARSTTFHAAHLSEVIAGGITHVGFAVVDALCQCPNQLGRMNRLGTPADMLRSFRDRCVRVDRPGGGEGQEELPAEKIPIGVLHRSVRPELTAEYGKLRELAKARAASRQGAATEGAN